MAGWLLAKNAIRLDEDFTRSVCMGHDSSPTSFASHGPLAHTAFSVALKMCLALRRALITNE
jgi:hypothetical protein